MSSQTAQQRYAAALQRLQQVAAAPDPAAVHALYEVDPEKDDGMAFLAMSKPEQYYAKLGLTSFRDFQSRGPQLVKAHCTACCHVMRLFADDIANDKRSAETLRAVMDALNGLASLLTTWRYVLPGFAERLTDPTISRQNSVVVPTVCSTDLLPCLGATAALVANLLQTLGTASSTNSSSSTNRGSKAPNGGSGSSGGVMEGSSSSGNSGSNNSGGGGSSGGIRDGSSSGGGGGGGREPTVTEFVMLLQNASSFFLNLWAEIVMSDMKEEGFSIAAPACLAALPSICALVRAVLCSLPVDASKELVSALKIPPVVYDSASVAPSERVAAFASGHLHMQYCAAFGRSAPERGCSKATAHMLARCEDYQWVLLVYLAFQLASTHILTKGGTHIEPGAAIPGLPDGTTTRQFVKTMKKQAAKEGRDMGGMFDSLGMLFGDEDDVPFSNVNKELPPLHERLFTALGMGKLVSNGRLRAFLALDPADQINRKLARMALWSVEHQFVQVGVPAPGIVGVPCGAHGPLLSALSEYLVTVGPEAVHFHACLQVMQRVVQDYADKQASGQLPAAATSSAAPSSSAAAAGDTKQQLDAGMVDGLAAFLTVAVPACVVSARNKGCFDMLEPSEMPVRNMSQDQWAGWLIQQLWNILDTLVNKTTGGSELLAAALWQQPGTSTAAWSLEWLVRCGPLDPAAMLAQAPPTAQGTRDTIRSTCYIAAACASPPPGASFDKAQTALACLLVSLLKRLKLIAQQSGGVATPPAAYRAVADVAGAAAALGRAVAGNTSTRTAAGKKKGKSSSSKGRAPAGSSSSSSDMVSVKRGPALWAVVAGHSLWWLGSQLPAALDATSSTSNSSSAAWGVDEAPDQLLGVFRVAGESLAWLAAALPSLPAQGCVALSSTAVWSERWQALQQQLVRGVQPAVQGAVDVLKQAASAGDGAQGMQWHEEEVKQACGGLVALGSELVVLLPCGVCCNHTGCCQLSPESERCKVGSERKVLLKCSACKLAHTCSKDCFDVAWPLHKRMCKLARSL